MNIIFLRHGESFSNSMGTIASDLEKDSHINSLTALGRRQIHITARHLKNRFTMFNSKKIKIFSSPFMRTIASSEIVSDIFPQSSLSLDYDLKERYFGPFDGKSASCYEEIWRNDRLGNNNPPRHSALIPEPLTSVRNRTARFIKKINSATDADLIIIVSHGDVLSVMATIILKQELRRHREVLPLANAEYRYFANLKINDL